MLNNTFEYKLHKIKIDKSENLIVLDITLNDVRMTLVNIYGPNNDNPNFFQNVL